MSTIVVPLPYSCGRFTGYSNKFNDFSVTIPRYYKGYYVNSFFPGTAKLWNSLPVEYVPLTQDFNGFKSRVNRHLLSLGFYQISLLVDFSFSFSCFSCSFIRCSGISALHGVNPN